jgi:hypothetical protein
MLDRDSDVEIVLRTEQGCSSCDHQNDVDEASGQVKREPEKPQYQQDDGNGSKHFGEPSLRSLTCSSP